MPKRTSSLDLGMIAVDPEAMTSLYQQLYDRLRAAVLNQQLPPGMRLPSTRVLAGELGISRNTVASAFDQLVAEGYLESRTGDGTYVSSALPDDLLQVRSPRKPRTRRTTPSTPRLSSQSENVAQGNLGEWTMDGEPHPFRTDLLALDHFPVALWGRLFTRRWRTISGPLLGYGDPAGYRPLREALAGYLGAARGVRCTWEQVIVTTGAQQGLDLAARTLINPGDEVWIEEPGYRGIRGVLLAASARPVPVPVDDEGLQVEVGRQRADQARAVYISPSHQYPIGVTMSLARRLALLDWAKHAQAWLFEDDYDSEYRYSGRPLSSLQGLDTAGRVIYIGTFSKVLFPALRLGYLVVPPPLIEAFTRMRVLVDRQSPTIEQAVVTDFIEEGHFARHLRHMRTLYGERQAILVEGIRQALGDQLEIRHAEAGLHVVGWLPPGVDDRQAAQAAARHQIETPALSSHAQEPLTRGGLMLGFAALNEAQIQSGIRGLTKALLSSTGRERA